MQQIERYGVIALVFLLVTIVAVSFWGDSKSPGFWSRLTGRGAKKEATTEVASNMIPPATSTERAIDGNLPLNAIDPVTTNGIAAVPTGHEVQPISAPGTSPTVASDPWAPTPTTPQGPSPLVGQPGPNSPVGLPIIDSTRDTKTSPHVPVPPTATGTQYVVQKGDSLIRIAARTLGSGSRWNEIQSLNPGLDPHALRPGRTIILPASAKLDATGSTTATSSGKRAKSAPKSTPPNTGGTYVVRAGDTLSSIASRMLGTGERWREIVAANPGLDPKRLIVGKSIRVPGAGAEASGAEGTRTAAVRPSTARAPVLAAAEPSSDRPHVR